MTLLCVCRRCFVEGEEKSMGPPMELLGREEIPCERCGGPVTRDDYHWVVDPGMINGGLVVTDATGPKEKP